SYVEWDYDYYGGSDHLKQYSPSLDWHQGIMPKAGEIQQISLGRTPFIPTSIVVKEGYVRLKYPFLRGYSGNSYVVAWWSDLPGSITTLINNNYINSSLYWIVEEESASYNHTVTEGNYTILVEIPLAHPIWNYTFINASFSSPSPDMNPPSLEYIDISSRITEKMDIVIEFSDESPISDFGLSYSTNRFGWKEVNMSGADRYTGTIAINDSNIEVVNLRFFAEDNYSNKIIYFIDAASLKERNISLRLNKTGPVLRLEPFTIDGICQDSTGDYCSGLRFSVVVEDSHRADIISSFEDLWLEKQGGYFVTNVSIPANFSGGKANISFVFKGTGVYGPMQEHVEVDVTTFDHDIALTSPSYSPFITNEKGTINVSVYNIGNNSENTILINLSIDGSSEDSATISSLDVGKGIGVSLEWTPKKAGTYNITVKAEPLKGENYISNNKLSKTFPIGPDILTRLSLEHYAYPVNKTIEAPFTYANQGTEKTRNLKALLYDIYEYDGVYSSYGSNATLEFDNETYVFFATRTEGGLSLDVYQDGLKATYDLYSRETVHHEGHFFHLDWIGENEYFLVVGNALQFSALLDDLEPSTQAEGSINFIPRRLGDHIIVLFLNSSGDVFWQDNIHVEYIEIGKDDADIGGFIEWKDKVSINTSHRLDFYLRNYGSKTAKGNSVHLFLMDSYISKFSYSNESFNLTFDDVVYGILVSETEEKLHVQVGYGNKEETYDLQSSEITTLGNGVFLDLSYWREGSGLVLLGTGEHQSKPVPDLAPQGDYDSYFTITPTEIGKHYLKLFTDTSSDWRWSNNEYTYHLTAVPPGPDIHTWVYAGWSYKIKANEAVEMEIWLENEGTIKSSNFSVHLYDLENSVWRYVSYGDIIEQSVGGMMFNISGTYLEKDNMSLILEYDNGTTWKTFMHPRQTVEIGQNIYLTVWQLDLNDYYYIFGKGKKQSVPAESLESDDSQVLYFNWSSDVPGEHTFIAFADVAEDSYIIDNYDSTWVIIADDRPDLDLDFWTWSIVEHNTAESFEVAIYNGGSATASQPTLYFYDMYDHVPFENKSVTFDNKSYTIQVLSQDLSSASIQITYEDSSTETIDALINGLSRLKDGTYLYIDGGKAVREAFSNTLSFYLGNAEETSFVLSDIGEYDYVQKEVNWTGTKVGKHILSMFVNTSKESDWTDNVMSEEVTVYTKKNVQVHIKNSKGEYATRVFRTLKEEYLLNSSSTLAIPWINQSLFLAYTNTSDELVVGINYVQSVPASNMSAISEYYGKIGDKYHIFANEVDWEYNDTQYIMSIDGTLSTITDDPSLLKVWSCKEWDFSKKSCSSGWKVASQSKVSVFVLGAGGDTKFVLAEGSEFRADAFAIGLEEEKEIPAPPPTSGGGGSGGGGGGSSGGSFTPKRFENSVSRAWDTIEGELKTDIAHSGIAVTKIKALINRVLRRAELTVGVTDTYPTPTYFKNKEVYQVMEFYEKNIPQDAVSKAEISFTIPQSWIASKDIDDSTINLYRAVQNTWNKLPTRIVRKGSFYSFTAESKGMSFFAIAGDKKKAEQDEVEIDAIPIIEDGDAPFEPRLETDSETSLPFSLLALSVMFILLIVFITLLLVHFKRVRTDKKIEIEEEVLLTEEKAPEYILKELEEEGYPKKEIKKEYKLITLKHYILKARHRGYTDMRVMGPLTKAGWQKHLIHTALKELEEESKKGAGAIAATYYIMKARLHGYGDEEITNLLVKAGWQKRNLRKIFKKLGKAKSP
ncbi:PGF-pre-PGF domain-containing protein, partial [Candidatus Woesearchaeota archaeon]|nr:PGF-pre-PGF domain-containing protein [Candidatus Woesearchaeota archaeon]